MIVFEKIRWKNLLSTGNAFTEIELNKYPNALIIGENGAGKCFCINTPIKVRNKRTGQVIETTIGEFYATQKKQNYRRED